LLGDLEEVLAVLARRLPDHANKMDVDLIWLFTASQGPAERLLEIVLLAPLLDGLGQTLPLQWRQRFQFSTTLRKFWKIS